jgi:riboflavin kinase / FMN adenylyltransferase
LVLPDGLETAVTVGTFDGLHRGHLRILEELSGAADRQGLRSLLVTFQPHPRHVLQPEKKFGLLTSTREKSRLLAELGINYLVVLRFDRELSHLPPERFVLDYLLARYRMRSLVVGYDHAFGRGRAGGEKELSELSERHGFSLLQVPPVIVEGRPVSSSRIRTALAAGDLGLAAGMLGRFYSFCGRVVSGAGRGRRLGHPTANLKPVFGDKQLFPDGIYAALVDLGGELFRGALHHGPRPTFDEEAPTLELNLFDYSGDLYGRMLEVSVVERIRPIMRFGTADDLIRQMDQDDLAVKKVFERIKVPADLLSRSV